MFEALQTAPAHNPTIAWQLQFQNIAIGLDVTDGKKQTLSLDAAGVELADGIKADCDFTFSASTATWEEFQKPIPAIGYQALSSMLETETLEILDGDPLTFARHSLMLEKLFAQLRPQQQTAPPPLSEAYIEDTIGRYLHVSFGGHHHRIYVEEAGQGIPLICLHTAGSDGRQYRGLMTDPEITENYRVIAFDLPAHGKSSPPAGYEQTPYLLTTNSYMEAIMAVTQALKLDKPIVMGCSIGGRAVLHLALRHGSQFRAAIGLQSAIYAESKFNEKMNLLDKHILYRPDMHCSEVAAASVKQIMAPQAPSHQHWETLWYYMQGGPGIFMGDLHYYFGDGDMRNGVAEQIDTQTCPVYLLTGEYDLSAPPEKTQELATAINAQHCETMKGLGHFPMSEDYQTFRNYLIPVLQKIEDGKIEDKQ